jgi:hypothetical protein
MACGRSGRRRQFFWFPGIYLLFSQQPKGKRILLARRRFLRNKEMARPALRLLKDDSISFFSFANRLAVYWPEELPFFGSHDRRSFRNLCAGRNQREVPVDSKIVYTPEE